MNVEVSHFLRRINLHHTLQHGFLFLLCDGIVLIPIKRIRYRFVIINQFLANQPQLNQLAFHHLMLHIDRIQWPSFIMTRRLASLQRIWRRRLQPFDLLRCYHLQQVTIKFVFFRLLHPCCVVSVAALQNHLCQIDGALQLLLYLGLQALLK